MVPKGTSFCEETLTSNKKKEQQRCFSRKILPKMTQNDSTLQVGNVKVHYSDGLSKKPPLSFQQAIQVSDISLGRGAYAEGGHVYASLAGQLRLGWREKWWWFGDQLNILSNKKTKNIQILNLKNHPRIYRIPMVLIFPQCIGPIYLQSSGRFRGWNHTTIATSHVAPGGHRLKRYTLGQQKQFHDRISSWWNFSRHSLKRWWFSWSSCKWRHFSILRKLHRDDWCATSVNPAFHHVSSVNP